MSANQPKPVTKAGREQVDRAVEKALSMLKPTKDDTEEDLVNDLCIAMGWEAQKREIDVVVGPKPPSAEDNAWNDRGSNNVYGNAEGMWATENNSHEKAKDWSFDTISDLDTMSTYQPATRARVERNVTFGRNTNIRAPSSVIAPTPRRTRVRAETVQLSYEPVPGDILRATSPMEVFTAAEARGYIIDNDHKGSFMQDLSRHNATIEWHSILHHAVDALLFENESFNTNRHRRQDTTSVFFGLGLRPGQQQYRRENLYSFQDVITSAKVLGYSVRTPELWGLESLILEYNPSMTWGTILHDLVDACLALNIELDKKDKVQEQEQEQERERERQRARERERQRVRERERERARDRERERARERAREREHGRERERQLGRDRAGRYLYYCLF